MKNRVLVIHSDPEALGEIQQLLEAACPGLVEIVTAPSPAQGLGELAGEEVLLVFLSLEGITAEVACSFVDSCDCRARGVEVVVLATPETRPLADQLLDRGVGDVLGPEEVTTCSLSRAVRHAVEKSKIARTLSRTQEQLFQAQKMEAMGQLVSGVAHEFNNLMTVIVGFTKLIEHDLPRGSAGARRLREVECAAGRAIGLSRQLLTFGRRQPAERESLEISEVITKMGRTLCRLLGEDMELKLNQGPVTGVVVADRVQLEMALVNLVVNARDSMSAGGRLEISTREVILHEPLKLPLSTVEVGDYACVEVSDNGCGMSEELQMQAFEPFFTTKEAGKGTGLGLSAVLGAVRNCHGHIDLHSTPGEGTTFRMYLPIDRSIQTDRDEYASVHDVRGGSETLLVAEDEDEVREVIADTLESGGYRVLTARNGHQAREILDRQADEVDMVLSDMVMPGMGGRELGAWIREHHPDLPVVYMSGYGYSCQDDELVHDLELPKPFSPDQLLGRVRDVLDFPQTAHS